MADGVDDRCQALRDLVSFYDADIEEALEQLAQTQQDDPWMNTEPLRRQIRLLRERRTSAYDAWRRCLAGEPFPPGPLVEFIVATAAISTDRSGFEGPYVVPNVLMRITFDVPRTGVSLERFAIVFSGVTASVGEGAGTFDVTTGSMGIQTSLTVSHPLIISSSASITLTTGSATPVGPFMLTGAPLNPSDQRLNGTITLVSAFQLDGGTLDRTAIGLTLSGTMRSTPTG